MIGPPEPDCVKLPRQTASYTCAGDPKQFLVGSVAAPMVGLLSDVVATTHRRFGKAKIESTANYLRSCVLLGASAEHCGPLQLGRFAVIGRRR